MDLLMVVLPAFMIFGAGFIGHKLLHFNIRSISTMALYLMIPFLTFNTFYSNPLNMDYLYMFLLSVGLAIILIIITVIVGLLIGADRSHIASMLLGTAFPNSGNYGSPVVLFALGPVAFNYAVIIMVIHGFLINTLGIFIASYGGRGSASLKTALMSVVKMPVLYGALFGVIFQLLKIELPPTILGAVELVGNASIPTVMLVLGMQLAEVKKQKFQMKYIQPVLLIRMVASPLIAMFITGFLPIDDLIKTVFIILAAMPIAANTTLLAVQFDVKAELVSFSTLITTLISLISIPLLLFYLGV